jgi:hypothetical protein
MAYLQHLKNVYDGQCLYFQKEFELHCQEVINKKLNFNISKLKKYIEENLFDEVTYFKDKDGKVEIDTYLKTVDLSDLFKDNFEFILRNIVDSNKIEDYLENLEPLKNLKQSIENEFDGLKFEFNICVECRKNAFNRYIVEEITCTPTFNIPWN